MANRDPDVRLITLLARLKRQKTYDRRQFQSNEEYRRFLGEFEEKHRKLPDDHCRNLLVREWYVRNQLEMDEDGPPRNEAGGYCQFAPRFTLLDGTTLVTLSRGDWAAYLIWTVEPYDGHRCYGFRWLTDELARHISLLNHEALRRHFGFARPRRKRTPPGYQGKEIM